MQVTFETPRLGNLCNDRRALVRKYGEDTARMIQAILADVEAVECLEDLRAIGHLRPHMLSGKLRKGQIAMGRATGYRVVVINATKPEPTLPDGSLDWTRVTCLQVHSIEDYHG